MNEGTTPKKSPQLVGFSRDDKTNTTYLHLGGIARGSADAYPAGVIGIGRPRDIHRIAAQIRGSGRSAVVI
jgi:hypothetical protein